MRLQTKSQLVIALISAIVPLISFAKEPSGTNSSSSSSKKVISIERLTAAARPSIVTITQFGRGGNQEALGTGFIISKDGLIATNLHVIGNARRIQVQTSDGASHDVTEIFATDNDLDLAIIRINQQNLTPLSLGNSKHLRQGQRVLAIGNPQGLNHSVVEGILSAVRDVEGTPMLQLAIPIEEGNSGGPVLDRYGKVQGIVTLKSAITENLGFAHPINQLKLLIERPNPIPMDRWLTIGKLNPLLWQPVLGARWSQHAGQIRVEGFGEGFGGRSNCIYKLPPPAKLPYEVSVDVKLDDESGAAGLLFCAALDADHHYGFYPTAGKLRLTRFNGPNLQDWDILTEGHSSAYIPNQWNTLKVRIETDQLLCFVNDQLIFKQSDSVFRNGNTGLCKFRNTKATFRNFQVAPNITSNQITDPKTLASIQAEIQRMLDTKQVDKTPSSTLLTTPAAARKLLQQTTRTLEQQAAALRQLQQNLHRKDIAQQLVHLLQEPDEKISLLHAALLIAQHDNPELDISPSQQIIRQMVEELRNDPKIATDSKSAALRLRDYLFKENGFHGTRSSAMDELSNSYLNEVIDDREGIPLTLSIVYLEIARQLGLKHIHGASLPGRFMISYKHDQQTYYLDLFNNGEQLEQNELEAFILESTGQMPTPEQLAPASPRDMVLRLLYNLVSFCKTPEQSIPYLDLILAIDPESAAERFNRALLRARTGDPIGAREDIAVLMKNPPIGVDARKLEALYNSFAAPSETSLGENHNDPLDASSMPAPKSNPKAKDKPENQSISSDKTEVSD